MKFNNIFSCCCIKKKSKYKQGISITEEVKKIIHDKSDLIKLNDSIFHIHNNNYLFSSPFRTTDTNFSKNTITELSKRENTKIKRKNSELRLVHNNKIYGLKDKLRCFFCGGIKCKHENYLTNIKNNNALKGLNSNYITENIIASQRPSEVLINKYNLVKLFKEENIGLIINLEREGEHPYCGPNAYHLTSCGFSYNPSVFTGNDILCSLYGWKDMSTPSTLGFMMEIVKEMTIMVKEENKKVLVHCHAGYGRTGVVIACYLIYNNIDCNVYDIIKKVRKCRKKCIENRIQKKFCEQFYLYVSHIRRLFDDNNQKEKIETFLRFQEELLCGDEQLSYGIVPMLLTKCLEKIVFISKKYNLKNIHIYQIIKDYSLYKLGPEINEIIRMLKESINNGNWELFNKVENLKIIVSLLFEWLSIYVLYIINPQRMEKILSNEMFKKIEDLNKIKKNELNEISKLIKTSFYSYEYETMFTVAIFINNYLPENNIENNLYKEMLDEFSLRLLGYEMNDIYNEELHNFEKIKKEVTGLSTILEYIVFTIPLYNETEGSPFISKIQKLSSIKNLKGDSRKTIFNIKRISKLNNYLDINHSLFNEIVFSGSNNNSLKMSNNESSISNSSNNKKFFYFDILNKSNNENKPSTFDRVNLTKYKNNRLNRPKTITNEIFNNLNIIDNN